MSSRARGFTILELLIVMSLVAVVALFVLRGFGDYAARKQFEAEVAGVHMLIREARQQTVASDGDAQYGVRFASSSVTLFQGAAYDPSAVENLVEELSVVTVSENLSDASSELVFARLTGQPSATGTITLSTVHGSVASTTLSVTASGIIE